MGHVSSRTLQSPPPGQGSHRLRTHKQFALLAHSFVQRQEKSTRRTTNGRARTARQRGAVRVFTIAESMESAEVEGRGEKRLHHEECELHGVSRSEPERAELCIPENERQPQESARGARGMTARRNSLTTTFCVPCAFSRPCLTCVVMRVGVPARTPLKVTHTLSRRGFSVTAGPLPALRPLATTRPCSR